MPTRPWPPPVEAATGLRAGPFSMLDLDVPRADDHAHLDGRAGGVPQGVGQPLLHDPVRRHVHRLRDVVHRPGHLHGDRGAGAPDLVDQLVELGQRRQRRQCRRLALADEPDDPAQLVDGLATEGLGAAQGLLLDRADPEAAAYDARPGASSR